MHERSAHLTGIGFMLLATVLFSLNDVLGKWLVASYSVSQILLLRSIAALIVLAPFIYRIGWRAFRDAPNPRMQILRSILATAEVACFYASVWFLPLADAMTFYLAGPIYVTAMSALFLRENVGIYRWSAVIVGFVGVLIALNPTGGSFGTGSVIALAGSIIYAVFLITTRQLRDTPNAVLAGGQALSSLLLGGATVAFAWSPVSPPTDYLLLLLLGAVSLVAIVCVNESLRVAPASVVVPYQYTLIVWAVLFGYVVFGDMPDTNTVVGAVVIVASGLFIFLREQRVTPAEQRTPPVADH